MYEWEGVKPVHCQRVSIQYFSPLSRFLVPAASSIGYPLVPRPISFGIKEPHCVTLHTVCNSTIQKTKTATIQARVKRGIRKRYDRSLAGLKAGSGRVDAIDEETEIFDASEGNSYT